MKSDWREYSKPIIREILARGGNEKEIRKALKEAYPFGERAMHPYKIWLDEIKRQRGLKPSLGSKIIHEEYNPNQKELF